MYAVKTLHQGIRRNDAEGFYPQELRSADTHGCIFSINSACVSFRLNINKGFYNNCIPRISFLGSFSGTSPGAASRPGGRADAGYIKIKANSASS